MTYNQASFEYTILSEGSFISTCTLAMASVCPRVLKQTYGLGQVLATLY